MHTNYVQISKQVALAAPHKHTPKRTHTAISLLGVRTWTQLHTSKCLQSENEFYDWIWVHDTIVGNKY